MPRIKRSLWICHVCGKSFSVTSNHTRHLLIHTGERAWACDICGKTFSQLSHLKTHLMQHKGEKPFKCGLCELAFVKSCNLKKHMSMHSKQMSLKRNDITNVLDQPKCLPSHTGDRHRKSEEECSDTDHRGTIHRKLYHVHGKHNEDRELGKCKICGILFPPSSTLTTHMLTHTGMTSKIKWSDASVGEGVGEGVASVGEGVGVASVGEGVGEGVASVGEGVGVASVGEGVGEGVASVGVGEGVASVGEGPVSVADHLETESKDKMCIGEVLGSHASDVVLRAGERTLETTGSGELCSEPDTKHDGGAGAMEYNWTVADKEDKRDEGTLKSDIPKRVHKCDQCEKSFAYPSFLLAHKVSHTGEKAFTCGICNKSFSTSNALKKHIHVHTGEKPYRCDMCDKSFALLGNLNGHKRVHTGEKPWKCGTCEKSFSKSCYLKTHMMIHTGEKPYECEVCGKSFCISGNLKAHKRMHTGERPWKCNVCGLTFSQSAHLKGHTKIHKQYL